MSLLVFCFAFQKDHKWLFTLWQSLILKGGSKRSHTKWISIHQKMGLSRPRCNLNLQQLAPFSNSEYLHLIVMNFILDSRKNTFQTSKGTLIKDANSISLLESHVEDICHHWKAASKKDLNYHTLALKRNWTSFTKWYGQSVIKNHGMHR